MLTEKLKKFTAVILLFSLIFSLAGCSVNQHEAKYKTYIESLITANYIGISKDYIRATGASEDDAEALYLQNASRLANNLSAYYDLDISGDHVLAPEMFELAKKIYSKTRFSVGDAYKENEVYYVDVTINPINILNQTDAEVREYVDNFNTRVASGEFNNYEREKYENEFARGIMDILSKASDNIEYKDPVTLKVRILTNDDSFYISDDDFRAIDAAILSTTAVSDPSETTESSEESSDEASEETTEE